MPPKRKSIENMSTTNETTTTTGSEPESESPSGADSTSSSTVTAAESTTTSSNSTTKATKKAKSSPTTFFETVTTLYPYTAKEGEREYLVRLADPDTCCDSPWDELKSNQWRPKIVIPANEDAEEGDIGSEDSTQVVIGGVWTADGKLVGFFGSDVGDSHIDLFGLSSYAHLTDLNVITGFLCETESTYCGIFDDGSGTERDVRETKFQCPELEHLYE